MPEQDGNYIDAARKMRAFYPLMIVAGLVQLLIPSTIHLIMVDFELKEGTAGMLPLIYFAGIVLSAFLANQLLERFSTKILTVASAVLVCSSLIAASLTPWFAIFVLFYFFSGLGNGALVFLPGIYATNTCGKEVPRIQSMLFGFLSFGYIVGPLIPGLIERLEISWRWAIAIPGLLVIPFVIPVAVTGIKRMEEAEKLSVKAIKHMIAFDRRFFVGITLAIVLAGGAALGVVTWIVTFLEKGRGVRLGGAHLVLCGVGAALVVGRLTCGKLSKRFSIFKILLTIIPASAVLVFIAPLPDSAAINAVLFIVSALVYAGIYPLLLSASSVYPRSDSAAAYTFFFIILAIGGVIVPYILGQIFQHAGAVAGMSSASFILLAAMGCLLLFRREMPLSEHANHRAYPG